MYSAVTELRLRRLKRKLKHAHGLFFSKKEKEPGPEERLEMYVGQRNLREGTEGGA